MFRRGFWAFFIFFTLLFVLLQTSFFPQFLIFRVKPDLVLVLVVSTGFLKGYKEGALAGFLAGIMVGIISANIWGVYTLVYSLAGFVSGVISERVEPDAFIVPSVSISLISLGVSLIFAIIGQSLDIFYPTYSDIYKVPIFIGWNTFFIMPIYNGIRYLFYSYKDLQMEKEGLGGIFVE